MHRPYEPVTFTRDVDCIVIPDGFPILVREGTQGFVTQVLGGNYTIQTDLGYLVRLAGKEAEAIGLEPLVDENAPAEDAPLSERVWGELRTIYDPEIPVNIVELGLVYACELNEAEGEGTRVDVQMTLTAPGCGMGQVLVSDVENKLRDLPGVTEVAVDLVFDPPWGPDRMSEVARLELGWD